MSACPEAKLTHLKENAQLEVSYYTKRVYSYQLQLPLYAQRFEWQIQVAKCKECIKFLIIISKIVIAFDNSTL